MSLDVTLRYSKKVRDQLIWLKRQTGLPHYHTLCRWAFCVSMSDASQPKEFQIGGEARDRLSQLTGADAASFELPWDRFGQRDAEILALLLKRRLVADKIDPTRENLQRAAQAHIQRGMSRLMAGKRIKTVADMVKLAVTAADENIREKKQPRSHRNSPN